MPEIYDLKVEGSQIAFAPSQAQPPKFALAPQFDPATAPAGLGVVCRMGAPDQLHCVIYREDKKAGGIFTLHEQGQVLFAAIAESELAYALAKSFFGALVSNARYGMDIYENEAADD